MLEAIQRFFRTEVAAPSAARNDKPHSLQVATCALLLEVAHADDEFSADEQQTILGLVRERFQLSRQQADELIALAEQERRQSIDMYQFTRLISDQFDRSQKLAILRQLWEVVYSDGRLEAHEDAMLHKLCNLLDLRHRELIALKLQVKQDRDSPAG